MKVGQMVYYITNGKLHYGEILYKDRDTNTLFIREKKHVSKLLESRVAREVSDECKRLGLESYGKSSYRQGVVGCKGEKEQL